MATRRDDDGARIQQMLQKTLLQDRVSELQRELKTHAKEQGEKNERPMSEANILSMTKEAVDRADVMQTVQRSRQMPSR